MRTLLLSVIIGILSLGLANAQCFQVFNPSTGKFECGAPRSSAPYSAPFTAATSVSVLASVHGQGATAVVESCIDNATPANTIALSANYPTKTTGGDLVIQWSGSKTGSCLISSGKSGTPGANGVTGASGPTGAAGPSSSKCSIPFTGQTSRTITAGSVCDSGASTHPFVDAQISLVCMSAAGVAEMISPTVNPTTFAVTINPGIAYTGTCILDGTSALITSGGGGTSWPVATKTSAYTAVTTDFTLLGDTTSAAFTITLPATPSTGQMMNIKLIAGGNPLTVAGNGKLIDGSTNQVLAVVSSSLQIQYDGTTWRIL